MRVESVEGFVLHARDYRDTSQLVDIFTETYGRVRLVARGSRSHKKNAFRLSPFAHATFGWTGRGELKTLTQFEPNKNLSLAGEHLICGFYINELLWHLLLPEDSHPNLYFQYKKALEALGKNESLEPLLRRFELDLLEEVGYGISFDTDVSGEPISEELRYSLVPELGGWNLTCEDSTGVLSGQIILNISRDKYEDLATQKASKKINRMLIDTVLEGKKLNSRELINQSRTLHR